MKPSDAPQRADSAAMPSDWSDADTPRRASLSERLLYAASGLGEALARTAGAASTLITDAELRRRGAQVVASNATRGFKNIQRGLQTVGQGPRQLQSVLQRLTAQMEERRMQNLLEEQQDDPMSNVASSEHALQDVQVAFQLYEDAPQELRSRLWMALLRRPELSQHYKAAVTDTKPIEGTASISSSKNSARGSERTSSRQSVSTAEQPNRTDRAENEQHVDHISRHSSAGGYEAESDSWEVVADRGAERWRQGRALLIGSNFHRVEPWTPAKESLRQELMSEMAKVAWPLPTEVSPEGRYGTLLQISVGQEDQEEAIARDVHRTFPEHPMFAFEQGQQALFRVLKAYSLHDLEVGIDPFQRVLNRVVMYCQGMAFVAGLLLFFVPEEPAFQILCRLLSAAGPDLRRHYLPGLAGLKTELKRFEYLLGRHLPALKAHLEAAGAVPVLFASQWFLSAFSCPFPISFACRLVDIMLVENSDNILARTAIAIMAESEADLLMLDDFEELLTYLKVNPVSWEPDRLRRVLNAALNSPITDQELEEAAAAAALEDHPLLGGPSESNSTARSDSTAAGSEQSANKGTTSASGNATGSKTDGTKERPRSRGHATRHSQGAAGSFARGRHRCEDDFHEETVDIDSDGGLEEHAAELDTALMAMVLDMERLWNGSGSGELKGGPGSGSECGAESAPQ